MAELMRGLLHSACHVLGGYNKDVADDGGYRAAAAPAAETGFRMPLHYPRYSKRDYEAMEEWRLDLLLSQYGIRLAGTVDEKRAYAIGAFLWPDQY
ncbi:unnamed protein product [Linum tenue]|uniref:DUF7722 domain-containing protein n=1 Tax=Linum tenue TaxID=586396 RepID=A0AAV0M1Q9_9ROSI|nr:unnamed protein product [Linum tenue]